MRHFASNSIYIQGVNDVSCLIVNDLLYYSTNSGPYNWCALPEGLRDNKPYEEQWNSIVMLVDLFSSHLHYQVGALQ